MFTRTLSIKTSIYISYAPRRSVFWTRRIFLTTFKSSFYWSKILLFIYNRSLAIDPLILIKKFYESEQSSFLISFILFNLLNLRLKHYWPLLFYILKIVLPNYLPSTVSSCVSNIIPGSVQYLMHHKENWL